MGRAGIVLVLGAVLARLIITADFGVFVQQRMRWPLILATVALIILGVYEAWQAAREHDFSPGDAKRRVAPSIGWMLILPLVVLLSVAPSALGAAAADRVDAFIPNDLGDAFPPLPESDGPLEMKVFDFLDRAFWDENGSLEGRVIRLEGLVVNDPDIPDGFRLTRFSVSCCAADGLPLQVALRDTGVPLEDDQWVIADVVWIPPAVPFMEIDGEWLVEAELINLQVAPDGAPNDPYESPY